MIYVLGVITLVLLGVVLFQYRDIKDLRLTCKIYLDDFNLEKSQNKRQVTFLKHIYETEKIERQRLEFHIEELLYEMIDTKQRTSENESQT